MTRYYIYLKRRMSLVLILLIFSSFMVSCLKDDFQFDKFAGGEYKGKWDLPLVNSDLLLHDVLTNSSATSFIEEDLVDHSLKLVYKGQVFSQYAEDVFKISNQTFNLPPAAFPKPDFSGGSTWESPTVPYSVSFTVGAGEHYDRVLFKGGTLGVSLTSNLNYDGQIDIVIPELKKNGVSFHEVINYQSGSNPTPSYDLNGYELTLGASGGLNSLVVNFKVILYDDAAVTPNPAGYNINFSLNLNNMKYSELEGYLGQKTFDLDSDTVFLDIFKNSLLGGKFELDDPRVKIIVTNSFGIPIDITFNRFVAKNDGDSTQIKGNPGPSNPLPNPFSISIPSNIGEEAIKNIELDKTNSTIRDAINLMPKEVLYSLNGLSNPPGSTSTNNFIKDKSRFRVDVEVEAPMTGKAKNFVIQDTIDFKMETVDQLESVNFRTMINNWFPVDASVQIYFVDDAFVKLDSLFIPGQNIIDGANPGPAPSYKVVSPRYKATDVVFNATRLEKMAKSSKMLIRASVSTSNGGNDIVKFYSDYRINVKMSTQVKLKVEF